MIYMNKSPDEAYNLVASLGPYLPFRDASMAMTNTFKLSVGLSSKTMHTTHCQRRSSTA